MIDSGSQGPLRYSDSRSPINSVKPNYFLRLLCSPFSFLQDVFHRFSIKKAHIKQKENSDGVEDTSKVIDKTEMPQSLLLLRRSAFFLLWTILSIEILFDLILVLIRLPTLFISIPFLTQKEMTAFYFSSFLLITLGKVNLMVYAVLRWVTTHYTIGKGEIRYKTGILAKNEKIYSCTLTQEVIYTQSFWGRIFNYGTIEVYNPAIKETIYMDSIPDPNKYVDVIKQNMQDQNGGGYIIERQ